MKNRIIFNVLLGFIPFALNAQDESARKIPPFYCQSSDGPFDLDVTESAVLPDGTKVIKGDAQYRYYHNIFECKGNDLKNLECDASWGPAYHQGPMDLKFEFNSIDEVIAVYVKSPRSWGEKYEKLYCEQI